MHLMQTAARGLLLTISPSGSRGVYISLPDRISRLILLSSTGVILIALWALLMELSFVSCVAAYKYVDYTAIRLADYIIFD